MKLTRLCKAITVALALGASTAFALPVSSAISPGRVLFSDNSAERMISADGNATLDIGDSLRGIFSIGDITSGGGAPVQIGGVTAFNELTGLFQVKVVTKVATATAGLFNYTFGFDSAFGQGAGVFAVLRDDPGRNFRRENCLINTFAGCEATAIDGPVWATLGMGANTFWSAFNANDTPGQGAILPLGTPLGTFGLGLDFITNNTMFNWQKVRCVGPTGAVLVDVCGQGGILATGSAGGDSITPFEIFNNVDFTANRIPEPGSMALVGLALLGLSLAGRGKKAS